MPDILVCVYGEEDYALSGSQSQLMLGIRSAGLRRSRVVIFQECSSGHTVAADPSKSVLAVPISSVFLQVAVCSTRVLS